MTITYEYGKNLYVNTTNRCTCACTFCIRSYGDGVGSASSLWLEREPTREEILADIESRDLSRYAELVFCGYGEPSYRLEDILWVCRRLKAETDIPIRMDTNGHGSLIHGRDVTPEIKGLIDTLSISLNRSTEAAYNEIVRPHVPGAFEAMQDFTRHAVAAGIRVIMTVVDNMDPAEIERCRHMCEDDLGAVFRVRQFSEDWT